MSGASPILSAYQRLIAKGRLQPNSGQLALVNQLGQLQRLLVTGGSLWPRSKEQPQNGIYIYGGVGTGKSRIADLFLSTLPASVRSRRTHFHEFMVDVHTRLHYARSQPDYAGDPLLKIGSEICSQSSVLCFDEFQVSDIADAMILKRLFGSFWRSGGIMVSTSNRHPTELYLNGLNRPLFIPFIKDLQERCIVWKMEGDQDYRISYRESGRIPVFFTDSTEFYRMMSDMVNGNSMTKMEIKVVMNRSMIVHASHSKSSINDESNRSNRSSKAVVHGTFHELCEATLGTSDYHALCDFAHTIFISDVRPLAARELDYLRRLITLIDIAYESRTRIICLSSVTLPNIFKEICGEPKVAHSPNTSHDQCGQVQHISESSKANLTVRGEGGSSSSMMSTFLNDVEWSATGLMKASLATGGAGETDVRFAVGRAISRLSEMGSADYGRSDE